MRGVILAAGRGSRLNGGNGDMPKCLVTVGGETLLSRNIRILRAAGIDDIVIVVGCAAETVRRETNPFFWEVLAAFKRRTGCPVIVNTSFNVRGEPIVCTPAEALRCFLATEMDALILENFVVDKREVGAGLNAAAREEYRAQFALD